MDSKIVIDNETIASFYRDNKHLDIVSMNLLFIDIMKNLSTNLEHSIGTTVNSKILDIVSEMNNQINSMKLDLTMKLHESKKEYIDDIKNLMQTYSLTNNDKINQLIEKSNDNLLTKTTLLINDIVPKSQEKNVSIIESHIKNYCSTICNDTQKLIQMHSKDTNNVDVISGLLETQMNKMINSIQQPIYNLLNANEDKSNSNFNSLRDSLSVQKETQLKMSSDINSFLSRYKNNSQFKGDVGETNLMFMLQSIMPTDEITRVNSQTSTCDIKVRRKGNKPSILFECKEQSYSVPTDEVEKFKRDLQSQKSHGIMISQTSPITYKSSFEIDIINGLIHVYIPNCENNVEKIQIAIDIIDNLHHRLQTLEKGELNALTLSKDDLDEILKEYKNFADKKSAMLETIKTLVKQLQDQLDQIQIPKIKGLLIRHGSIENDRNSLSCKFCNCFEGKNKLSISAHIKKCKSNPENVNVSDEDSVVSETATAATPVIKLDMKQVVKPDPSLLASKNAKTGKTRMTINL
jgi:hypothetical protein